MAAHNPWGPNQYRVGSCFTAVPLGEIAVSPHDTNELAHVCRGLIATVAGSVAVVYVQPDENGADRTGTWVLAANTKYEGFIKRVLDTGTDAEGIRGIL